jgi:hypothetical protein
MTDDSPTAVVFSVCRASSQARAWGPTHGKVHDDATAVYCLPD